MEVVVCVDLLPRIVDVERRARRTGCAQLVMKRLRRERGQKGGGGGVKGEQPAEGCGGVLDGGCWLGGMVGCWWALTCVQ